MFKNILGTIRNMFTNANDNGQSTTANVNNNANGTTDGQSNNNNNDGTSTTGNGTANVNPTTVGTTPELRDGSGVVVHTTFADTANELANVLAESKTYIRIYTEQLADTTDERQTTTVRDRLTFWQNKRDELNARLASLTDDERATVGQLFTERINILNATDEKSLVLADTKSATFALNNARSRYDKQRDVVKSANDDAKSARDNATAQRDELNAQRLAVSRLAVLSGNANDDDRSLLARQDVTDNANEVLANVAKKLGLNRQKGNKILRDATDKIRSLSNIVKSIIKNFADFAPFFNLYGVPFEKSDVKVDVMKSDNVHPFMLVPTVDGLKVCDPVTVGRSVSPLTRWNEEKYCQLVVLNHFLKLEHVADDRLQLHVVLLNNAVDALQRAKDKKDTARLTNARCEELANKLAELADPNTTSDEKFDISLYVRLTNELADEKSKLRAQLAEQRQAEKNANDAKSDVLNDKKSDDATTTVHNARSNKNDNGQNNANNGQSDVQTTDGQSNVQTTDTTPVQDVTTTDGQSNGQTDVQTADTKSDDVKNNGTTTRRRRSGNGTKSGNKKSGNGTSGSRTRTTARRNVKNDTKSDTTPVLADGTNGK